MFLKHSLPILNSKSRLKLHFFSIQIFFIFRPSSSMIPFILSHQPMDCFINVKTQVHRNRNAPSERMFKPIMPRKVSPNESPWEIQLKKKATTTYLSPVVDPFVCVYLLVVSSSSSRLVFLYLSSVAQKIQKPIQNIPMFRSSHFWFWFFGHFW